ncbi:MAG: hypothetical protein PHC51_01210 [bacterium]|nr:hypothetical protein [bacterium]
MAQVTNLNLKLDAASSPAQIPAITNTYIFGSLSFMPGISHRLSNEALAVYVVSGLFFLAVTPEKTLGLSLLAVAGLGKMMLELMHHKARVYVPQLLLSLWLGFVVMTVGCAIAGATIVALQAKLFTYLMMSVTVVGGLNHLQLHKSALANTALMLTLSCFFIALFSTFVRFIG